MAAGVSNCPVVAVEATRIAARSPRCPALPVKPPRWPSADPAAAMAGALGVGSCRTLAWPVPDAVALARAGSLHRPRRRREA